MKQFQLFVIGCLKNKEQEKKVKEFKHNLNDISKHNYEQFMLKEIHERNEIKKITNSNVYNY